MDLGRHRWGMNLFYIAWICLTCLNKSSPSSIETVCERTGPLRIVWFDYEDMSSILHGMVET